MERMYIKYYGIKKFNMKCFFLIIASLFSGLGINANVIDEIKGLYGYPYTICGIVIDCCVSNDNLIV